MNMEKATMKAAFPETKKKNGASFTPSDFLDRVKRESAVLRQMLKR